jgi:hypothetical protein
MSGTLRVFEQSAAARCKVSSMSASRAAVAATNFVHAGTDQVHYHRGGVHIETGPTSSDLVSTEAVTEKQADRSPVRVTCKAAKAILIINR